jgi:hypothetical protein
MNLTVFFSKGMVVPPDVTTTIFWRLSSCEQNSSTCGTDAGFQILLLCRCDG